MGAWTREDRLAWRPLEPFGAELDCDLARPMTDKERSCFVDLFHTRSLLVLHGQRLSLNQQIEVVGQIGPVVRKRDGLSVLSAEKAYGARELIYHSDYAFAEHPLQAISLHALEVVDGASSTRFVSSVAAHQALPAELRARAEALDADFVAPATEVQSLRACDTRPEHQLLHERRPVVQRHPATGQPYVAVNEMQTAGILDVEPADGKAMLEALFGVLYRPENLYEHRWMTGDIVIWDNLALQHARGDLSSVGRRELQRVCCGVSLYDMYPELDAKY